MDILAGLNDEQQRAVTHTDGPLLIVAGAGTGKTTVMTRRIAWLIDQKLAEPSEILALTFTDKAATEMEERVDRLLPYGYTDLWVSTFHAFGQRLLSAHAVAIGLPQDFTVLSETEQWMLMRKNIERFQLSYYRPLGNPTKFLHALVTHFSRAKDEQINPDAYLAYAESLRLNTDRVEQRRAKRRKLPPGDDEAARIEEVAHAYHVYQQLLHEAGALDFGDLITYSLRLLTTRPEILERYRRQFRFIVVDEFQDTNTAQYELVKLLAAPRNNVAVVGDDDQSIYRFRGASMSNILQFRTDFPDSASVILTRNYRSTQNILDASYGFIKQNDPHRLEHQLATAAEPYVKRLTATASGGGAIQHLNGRTLADEQALVIERMQAIMAAAPNTSWGDIAVLARSNELANQFADALSLARIPHYAATNRGLYHKPVVVDAVAYLRLLDNYHESPSLWRVLLFPVWELSGDEIVAVSHYASKKAISLYEAVRAARNIPNIAPTTVQKLQRVLDHVSDHTEFARRRRPSEVLVKALTDSGYTAALEAASEATARVEFSYLNQFYQRIRRWEETQSDPRLKEFMLALHYELESGERGALEVDPELGPDAVRVMTVHSAKGLEFQHVFIVGLVDRRFPATERAEPITLPDALLAGRLPSADGHLEEERRLMYVAMTRAKRGLYLTSAEDYGGSRKKRPSRFLVELKIPLSEPVTAATAAAFPGTAPRSAPPALYPEPIPDHFSFTALKAFQTCPLQYRYAHVLRVPVWGRHTLSFGQSMHLALERFFRLLIERREASAVGLFGDQAAVRLPTKADLLRLYEEAWIDEWYPSRSDHDRYFAEGKQALSDFYDVHASAWPATEAIEQGFVLKVGKATLRGKIDRIDRVGDGIEIIDYKTGRVHENLDDVDRDQLLIYQLAAREALHQEAVKLTFYYLNANKPLSFVGSEEELVALKEKIVATVDRIQEGKFPADPSPRKCRQCDFRTMCPFSAA